MEDFNEDVENSTGSSHSNKVMGIESSPNYVCSNNGEMVSDNVNVDEWFKPRNESVANTNVDAVIKNDVIDSNYLDALSYHLMSQKDSIDMCIVANICDMGLGLELPGNTCDKKLGALLSLSEKDSSSRILSDFQEQNPLLEGLESGDILDKDILVAVDSSELGDLIHSSKYEEQPLPTSYVLEPDNENVLPEGNSISSQFKDASFGAGTVCKVTFESLTDPKKKNSSHSGQSEAFGVQKDVDFSEFNFLTFQVDPSDGMNSLSSLPQIEYCDNEMSENHLLSESDSMSQCNLIPEPCSISEIPLASESCNLPDSTLGDRWFNLSETSLVSEQYSSSETSLEQNHNSSESSPKQNQCVLSFVPEQCSSSETLLIAKQCHTSDSSLINSRSCSPKSHEGAQQSISIVTESSEHPCLLEATQILEKSSLEENQLLSGKCGSSEDAHAKEKNSRSEEMGLSECVSSEVHNLRKECNSAKISVAEQCSVSELVSVPEQCISTEVLRVPDQCASSEVQMLPNQGIPEDSPETTTQYCSTEVPVSPDRCSISSNTHGLSSVELETALTVSENCSSSETQQSTPTEVYAVPAGLSVFIAENSNLLRAYNVVVDEKDIVTENLLPASAPTKENLHSEFSLQRSSSDELNCLVTENNVSDCSNNQQPINISKMRPTINICSANPRNALKAPLHATIQSENVVASKTTSSNSSLKKTLETISVLKSVPSGQENSNSAMKKRGNSMAVIAISTNKTKNTTEIIINTALGEQKFEGKTSEIMKARSNVGWNDIDDNLLKCKEPNMINVEFCQEEEPPSSLGFEDDQDIHQTWIHNGTMKNPAVEKPITEALLELGIDANRLKYEFDSKGQKLYMCPYKECCKLFSRLSMLKVHVLTHYGVRPFKCDYEGCHWTFYTYFKLKRHKETHLKRKQFICPVNNCGRRFTTIYNLNSHQKLHERPAEMVCPVETCRACFQTKRSMELHMKKHDSQHAPYRCTYEGCGKHYYSANSLNCHIRSHQYKEEEVKCQWEGCGKLFDKPCRLKAHMRTHTGDKPYPCSYQDCGWAFSSASKLKRHQHKHTNERRFRCTYDSCNKSFMRSEHLKEHALTHVGARTFHCTIENCGVKFSAKSSLYVHLKKHNNQHHMAEERLNYCPIDHCRLRCGNKRALRQHMMLVHSNVEASGSNLIDYPSLFTGDEDYIMLEDLQLPTDIVPVTNDLLGAESISAVLPAPDPQSPSYLLNQSDSETSTGGPILEMHLQEDSEDDVTSGSARTSYTYQDIVQYRGRKTDECSSTSASESSGLRLPADVVLGTGILGSVPDITNTLLLQDDQCTYPDDSIVSGVGEFQVLLLDPGGTTSQEFCESTINLRDLE